MTSTRKVWQTSKRKTTQIEKGAIYNVHMNRAAILPREERCVCKCRGSESVWCPHLYRTSLTSPARPGLVFIFFCFWFLWSFAFMLQCRQRSKGEGGSEWCKCEDGGTGEVLTRWWDVCRGWGWGGSPGGRDGLSNDGFGGSTGNSAVMMTCIPWCSGAEWNLGRCFGNQGGSRSASRNRNRERGKG